jgi:hypothetical protein
MRLPIEDVGELQADPAQLCVGRFLGGESFTLAALRKMLRSIVEKLNHTFTGFRGASGNAPVAERSLAIGRRVARGHRDERTERQDRSGPRSAR